MTVLFACDLDNTLIHPRRAAAPGDVCVEWLEGRELSYVSPFVRDALPALAPRVLLVPVTTRSVEQYRRIRWPEGAEPEYAVTTNGAILLHHGVADAGWLAESGKLAAPFLPEMDALLAALSRDGGVERQRMVDGRYVFALCADADAAAAAAARYEGRTGLDVFVTGRKVYFLPPRLTKGGAAAALRERFAPRVAATAGDSPIDVPLLDAADVAFCPAALAGAVRAPDVRPYGGEGAGFADFVVRGVLSLVRKEDSIV